MWLGALAVRNPRYSCRRQTFHPPIYCPPPPRTGHHVYVLWSNKQLLRVVDDGTAGMTIKAPGFAGRDLVELRMVPVPDPANPQRPSEELRIGSMVFRRAAP